MHYVILYDYFPEWINVKHMIQYSTGTDHIAVIWSDLINSLSPLFVINPRLPGSRPSPLSPQQAETSVQFLSAPAAPCPPPSLAVPPPPPPTPPTRPPPCPHPLWMRARRSEETWSTSTTTFTSNRWDTLLWDTLQRYASLNSSMFTWSYLKDVTSHWTGSVCCVSQLEREAVIPSVWSHEIH